MHALTRQILEVRKGGALIVDPDPALAPADPEAAYVISAELAPHLGVLAGYKVGATSAPNQKTLGLQEPFYGRIPADRVVESGAGWAARPEGVALEPEILIRLATDLDHEAALARFEEDPGAVHAGIEINRPSFAQPFSISPMFLLADNGLHEGLVVGPQIDPLPADWSMLEVRLLIDGQERGTGRGDASLGNPLRAVRWLAEKRLAAGDPLLAGMWVATGSICFAEAFPGQQVVADFGAVGRVELGIVAG